MLALVAGVVLGASSALAARASEVPEPDLAVGTNPADAVEAMAQQKFGALTAAERMMLRGAPYRDIQWVGPDSNPDNPANDPAHGDKWGPERTIRATVIEWLLVEPLVVRFVHPSGIGVVGARIDGKLDLSYLSVRKPLTLLRCYLPDGVDISNAHLDSIHLRKSTVGPIDGDMSTVAGDVTLSYGNFRTASFFRAQIGGDLDCTGSSFSASGQTTVSATEASIGGDALFNDGFTTDGIVDFRLAKIGRSLGFNDAHFIGSGDNGLNAERATINGPLYWVNIKITPRTVLDLENASVETLWDDAASWPSTGNLTIEGFTYDAFSGGPDDASSRLKWLTLQPAGYHPRPYRQVAKVLNDSGREYDASTVLIAKEEQHREFGGLSWIGRAWNFMLDVTIGYGHRPLRALWWIFGFVLLGTVLFGWGYHARIVTPTDEAAYQAFVNTGAAPPHYPPFNAVIYSLENFLPVVDLNQGNFWRPNPRHRRGGALHMAGATLDPEAIPGTLLRWYLWIHILAGWTLTPLLFAGLSGIVRMD